MGKNADRKPRPAIPRYAWLDRDGCWFCKNRKGCNNCKANKEVVFKQKQKKKRQDKKEIIDFLKK